MAGLNATKMAQPQIAAEVVPKDFEVTESARKWQHELDELHARHEQLKLADQAEFEAEKEDVAAHVEERREEQRAKLDADVHKYMTAVQKIMEGTLAELHEEKLQRLENQFEKRLLEREKARDRHLLEHLKKYKSIVDASTIPPESKSLAATNSTLSAKARKPLPGDRRQGRQQEEKAPASKVAPPPSGFQPVNQPQRKLSKTKKYAEGPGEQGRPAQVPAQSQPLAPSQNGPNSQGSVGAVLPGVSVDVGRVIDPLNVRKGGKRKLSDQSPVEQENANKRQRVHDGSEYGHEVVSASSASPSRRSTAQKSSEKVDKSDKIKKPDEPRKPQNDQQPEVAANSQKKAERQVISFNEVFQDGNAEFKHTIVEFPPNSNEWYILRCDEHHVHFGLQPLLGAAKHLHSVQHKNLPKLHTLAVELLGHLVVDCTKELAAKNNAVVKKAFDKGYVPFNVNRLTRGEKISQGYLAADSPNATSKKGGRQSNAHGNNAAAAAAAGGKKTTKAFTGITNPIPGELYLGYWSKTKIKYAIMVFPFQGSIEITGLRGNLASVGLVANAPRSVRVNPRLLSIQGWSKEYEDGGALVTKREFPVVYFDRKHQVGWLPVKYISPFDFEDPKAALIPEYHVARDRYASLKGFESYEAMKAVRGIPPYMDVNGGKDYFAPPSPGPAIDASGDATEADGPTAESANVKAAIEDEQAGQDRQPIHEDEHTSTRVNSIADDEMTEAPPLVADNDTESYVESVDQSTDDDEYGMRARQGGAEATLTAPSSRGSPRAVTTSAKATQAAPTSELSQPADKVGSTIVASGPATSLMQHALQSAQQIAAKALNLSPERDVTPSAREEPEAATSTAEKIAQAITAATALHGISETPADERQPAASGRYLSGGLPRISSIQDILGTDISPIRHRPAVGIGGGHDMLGSKSVSPSPTPGVKVVPPPRFPSAQPLRNGIALPPPPPSDTSRIPATTSDMAPQKQGASPPLALPRQFQQEAASSRSPSSTPGPTSATDSASRRSTPTVLKASDMDKWKAVRSASGMEPPAAAPVQAHTPKDTGDTASPHSTPGANIKADPSGGGEGRVQDFDIVSYHGDSRRWVRESNGPSLRLSVDPARPNIAETGNSEALHVTVDPRRVTTMLSEPADTPGATAVEMAMKEGGAGRQRLVFEKRESGGRLESDKLQVRRFAQWVKSVNPAVVYQPLVNRDEVRRPSLGTTRESAVTID